MSLLLFLAGAIYSYTGGSIYMDGDTCFTNNAAIENGGETGE